MPRVATDDASIDAPRIFTLFKRLTRTAIRSCVSFYSPDLLAKTHISVILAIAQNTTQKMLTGPTFCTTASERVYITTSSGKDAKGGSQGAVGDRRAAICGAIAIGAGGL